MAILSKEQKPDNFESHNSLKFSFINIQGFRLNFVGCESFFESNFHDILTLFKTHLDYSIDSSNFSVRGYLPLIRKDSVTHTHDSVTLLLCYSCSLSGGKTSFCTRCLSRKLFMQILMFLTGFTAFSILLLFPLLTTFSVFMLFHIIDEI